jgi:hypothetical protein
MVYIFNSDNNLLENKFHNLNKYIIGLIFNRIKKISFENFKKNTINRELEQIKIYNIKSKEEPIEIIVLQEKYVIKIL